LLVIPGASKVQNLPMKIFFLVCLLFSSAAAQQATPKLSPPQQSANVGKEANSNENKAHALLKQMLDAMGGQAYLNLQDSYSEGRYGRFHNEAMVGGAVFYRYWEWPDKERFEVTKDR